MPWIDDTLRLRPPVTGAALRVGLWLENLQGLPFIAEAIQGIRKTTGLTLTVVFVTRATPAADSAPSGILYRLYELWNQRHGADHLLKEVDLQPLLEGVTIRAEPPSAQAGLDVLVSLGVQPRHGDCAGVARYGVWSIAFGDPVRNRSLPFYFWELQRHDAVSELFLFAHPDRLETGRIIYHYCSSTLPTWYFAVNGVEPMSMAPVILIRRLLDVQQCGWTALTRLPGWGQAGVPLEPRRGYPGAWTLFCFLCGQVAHRVRQRIVHFRGEAKWFVCYRHDRAAFTASQPHFRGDGFTPIPSPPHSTFADPFLIEREDRVYLFVEEIVTATSRGHFSACEIRPQGLSEFRPILQRPYHLSYPCVLEWNGEVYIIPESGANRTLELYRADSFPYSWRFEKMLQEDIALVDTTPFFQNGLWYFFTTTVDVITGRWLETWLFYSSRLDGEWQYHPSNPICSDVRRARSAGHLFYRGEKLIRPAQDCSIRYGYAIVFNEVLKLSPTEYEERQDEVIFPDWMPGIFATHTLNATPDVEVIDATRIPKGRP